MHIHPSTWLRRRPAPQRMRLTVRKNGVDAQGCVNMPVRPGDEFDVFYTVNTEFDGFPIQRDVRISLVFTKD